MTSITIDLPPKLHGAIEQLVEKGYFSSLEDFALHATRLLAEIYGIAADEGGVKLFDKLKPAQVATSFAGSNTGLGGTSAGGTRASSSSMISDEEQVVLDAFGSAKYEFENTLFMQYQMDALRTGQKPMPKEQFIELLESLQAKGVLERFTQNNKTMWKKLS